MPVRASLRSVARAKAMRHRAGSAAARGTGAQFPA